MLGNVGEGYIIHTRDHTVCVNCMDTLESTYRHMDISTAQCAHIPCTVHFVVPSADMLFVEYSKVVGVHLVIFPFFGNSLMVANNLNNTTTNLDLLEIDVDLPLPV